LGQEGLKVIAVSYHNIHAGTLRVISSKDQAMSANPSVQSFLNIESSITLDFCKEWGINIQSKIREFENAIKTLSEECNSVIVEFGACAKGCVFLNTCHLTNEHVAFVIDDTPEKLHKFIPGTGIQIVERNILKVLDVDYVLILAHNFKDYIIDSLRKDGYIGKFIVMFPNIQFI
jgi:hypothetical protein